jgi:hypothetical protein
MEMVPLLYSRPTFTFDDYSTFLAFSESISEKRYHSIRSIRIVVNRHTNPFGGKSSYHSPRELCLLARNSNSPSQVITMSDPLLQEELHRANNWGRVCLLLTNMRGLKRFHLDANVLSDMLACHLSDPTNEAGFWSAMENMSKIRDWSEGFEVWVDHDYHYIEGIWDLEFVNIYK